MFSSGCHPPISFEMAFNMNSWTAFDLSWDCPRLQGRNLDENSAFLLMWLCVKLRLSPKSPIKWSVLMGKRSIWRWQTRMGYIIKGYRWVGAYYHSVSHSFWFTLWWSLVFTIAKWTSRNMCWPALGAHRADTTVAGRFWQMAMER